MARKTRNSPEGAERRDHWLRGDRSARARPWAYEELLFGSAWARRTEERIVVRSAPPLHGTHLAELVLRLRKALSVGHSAS
jgi:hypothetical protein